MGKKAKRKNLNLCAKLSGMCYNNEDYVIRQQKRGWNMNQCNENMPYIFISYSHRDSNLVLPIISRLSAEGYNVWYDAGIEAGSEWDENIASHIGRCSYFIAFVSKNYINSKNCKDELNYSRDLDKEQFLIHLEDVELPGGMAMRMNRIQAIYWNKYMPDNVEAAYHKIFTAVGIEKTRVFVPNIGTYTQVQPGMPHVQAQPTMPHVQLQQAQPVLPHTQGTMNASPDTVSGKKEYVSFLKPALIICGVLFIVFLALAVILGVVLVKKKTNPEENTAVNTEIYADVDSSHPLYEYYERAKDGDVSAMVYLSEAYYYGTDGMGIDYEKSLYWSEMAAESGDVEAMYNIASLYFYEHVYAADGYQICIDWCTRILEIEPNNADAMHMIGNCYYWGKFGVEEDPELAFIWWHEGASRGHLDSIYNVAWCYGEGYGVEPDYDKAMEWNQILIDARYEF